MAAARAAPWPMCGRRAEGRAIGAGRRQPYTGRQGQAAGPARLGLRKGRADMSNLWLRLWRGRHRLWLCAILGAVVVVGLHEAGAGREVTRWLIGWNSGAIAYLALAMRLMLRADQGTVRQQARAQDEGELAVLILVVVAAIAGLGAIVAELAVARDQHGLMRALHIGLAALTVLSSWAFTQVMFALHYAHEFYQARDDGQPEGLSFPNTPDPDYMDFLYASAIVGTSAQTADVSFSTSSMRRVGLLHSVLAFFFNTTLIALTVNVGSNLL